MHRLEVINSKTPKIYKSNKLNDANFSNFTHNDYQVFLHLVTKIGGVNEYGKYLQPEELQREYVLSAKEFSELFNVSLSNCYGILKKAVNKLMKTDIKVERTELKEMWQINVCSMAKYNKTEGTISVEFTDRIMPYLAQVRAKFVLYNLKEIGNFGSLYTTRLYELIQEFKETGWMLKSVKQLREIFAVGTTFKRYGDFKKYTFGHACKEINDNYNVGLSFEELKDGRKVTAIKFTFKSVIVKEVINQKTELKTKIYIKPKSRLISKKQREPGLSKLTDILENQLSFDDIKPTKILSKGKISSFISKLALTFTNKK